MEIFLHHPLRSYNTFGIEAYAHEFVEVKTDDELRHLLNLHQSGSKKLIILGGGSNVLFTGDFAGTVIKISTHGIKVLKEDEKEVHLRVAAGEDWDGLVEFCVNKEWGGLENLSGIPGQVGSSPIQNIGAYGTEIKDHFVSLEAINQCTGETIHYGPENCQFGYRDSIFKRALRDRVVITYVVFCLQKNPGFNLTYQALKQELEHLPAGEINLRKIREAVLQIRSSKLPDPKMIGNAGSFFKNPVISNLLLDSVKEKFPEIIYYENSKFQIPNSKQIQDPKSLDYDSLPPTDHCQLPTANYKLAAGWLIEQCGWKGYRAGDAGVHKDQALVIVNYGKATGLEILDLSGKIQRSVKEKFGIDLEREVNVV
jgi:UDP-N-acetylmuramate dehydrogenase